MSLTTRQDEHTLAGAYALHALPEDERHRFERHMAYCDDCVEEVRGLRETAALLGDAASRTPPERLRRRVLDEVHRTRQLAPAPLSPPPPPLRWWQARGGLILAACLVVVLALGGVAVFQQQRIGELRGNQSQIASVLSAPDAETTAASPMEGVTATVVASRQQGSLVFTTSGLEDLPEEDYQLWLAEPDGSVRSAGLLSFGEEPSSAPLLASGVGDAEGVAVTIEPDGGSEQPTTEPIMSMPIDG